MSRRSTDDSAPETVQPDGIASTGHEAQGKGKATPTRKEREAANRRPLVPSDRKEASKQAKAQLAEERERARVGLAAGDERYLPARDKGPQKKWIRDYVDSRFNVGEYLIPVMFVVILATVIPSPQFQSIVMLVLWAYFLLSVLDAVFLGRRVKRRIAQAVGVDRVEKGVRWYAAMRAFQLRLLRLPKPRVKRFKPIEDLKA
ncbi:DUF3043 domain-containing protein [Mycetocola reblochoni]|uniref:CblZ, a non-orthologous displasment for Alpha-ribazole-5'-phosphate phosphatase n=1 Tax=Mycetocola reblochoni REB411 TaxID=1255698 RepID=A0A1R4J6S3_9MICO|nr:DUF3043 domain-containing protein [Mycetocola reblochoni]SJN27614.1 CblZ, a non-orthologous displasment for Alpha-ribazole-5'-phosphate phosphatase [Mycetocola reblochoni REB411]